jgi:hypothetical protein
MPDQPAGTPDPSPAASAPAVPAPPQPGPTIRIGDEFGTAKRNLPPAKVLLLALAGVLILAAIIAFTQRAKPQATGSIDNVVAVQIPNQDAVLVALTLTLDNSSDKPLSVRSIQGKLVTSSGELTSDAVSAIDFDRYFQAFPALKANSESALAPEDKIQPNQRIHRTVIISFPVTFEAFNQRRSVSVIIQPYDQPLPVTLTK